MARPIPWPAPVTMATLPGNLILDSILSDDPAVWKPLEHFRIIERNNHVGPIPQALVGGRELRQALLMPGGWRRPVIDPTNLTVALDHNLMEIQSFPVIPVIHAVHLWTTGLTLTHFQCVNSVVH